MAEERREHRRSYCSELHHAGNNHVGQWIDIRRGGEQHDGNGDQRSCDADGESCSGRALDHNLAHESDGDSGTDGNLHGGCSRDSTAQLPVAEERREHRRSYCSELHHAGDNHIEQWIDIRCGGEQHGGNGDQRSRDADGESCSGRALDHNLTHESDCDSGTDSDLHGGCGRNSTAQLPVAEEWREHRRSYGNELHDAGNSHVGQWIDVRRGSEQHGGNGDQRSCDADGESCSGRALDHNLTHESDRDSGTDSDLHGGCGRDSTAQLPVAEERREHRRSYCSQLHHTGNSHVGQWIDVCRGSEQHGGNGDQRSRDADGESCSGRALDHNLTHESDRDGGTDSDLHGGCGRNSTAQLPVAEERREHRRSYGSQLHHAGNRHVRQWIDIRCGGEQHGGNGDQRSRDADGESCSGRALDHNLTHESDCDSGTDSDLHGGCGRNSTAQLPVAEERREHRRSYCSQLHHAGNRHVRQWIDIRRGGEQHGGNGDQRSCDADGESCPGRALDHNLTHESDCDGGTDSDLHGGCGRDSTAQLPVAEERREHRRSYGNELHHTGNSHVGQRIDVRCGSEQHGGNGDQRSCDADGESCSGRTLDHNLTHESDCDSGTDSNLHGGCGRDSTTQLPVAEERREYRRSYCSELHHAGDNHIEQWIDIRCGGEQHGGNGDQRSCDADGESCPGRALDHNLTHESDCDGGTDSDLHGGCGRNSTAQLPVAEERREHRRSYRNQLHHTGNRHVGQRIHARRGSEQHGGNGDQRSRDADGESCSGRALDHNLTHESDRDSGTDSDLHGGCGRNSTAQLPVAEERREHRRSYCSELHHAGDNHIEQWIDIRCGGEQHGGNGDQRSCDADGESCSGRALDHNLTHESDCDSGTDSDLHGGCGRNSTAQLPVAEERREHRRSYGNQLHHTGNRHVGQWIHTRRSSEQRGGNGDQRSRDADGKSCSGGRYPGEF